MRRQHTLLFSPLLEWVFRAADVASLIVELGAGATYLLFMLLQSDKYSLMGGRDKRRMNGAFRTWSCPACHAWLGRIHVLLVSAENCINLDAHVWDRLVIYVSTLTILAFPFRVVGRRQLFLSAILSSAACTTCEVGRALYDRLLLSVYPQGHGCI